MSNNAPDDVPHGDEETDSDSVLQHVLNSIPVQFKYTAKGVEKLSNAKLVNKCIDSVLRSTASHPDEPYAVSINDLLQVCNLYHEIAYIFFTG